MEVGVPVRTLLIVPGLFGTEIVDAERGPIWGPFSCLYRGPLIGELPAPRGRAGRVITGLSVGRFVVYDIIGALLRKLGQAGYERGRNLFIFGYDWRQQVIESGVPLA